MFIECIKADVSVADRPDSMDSIIGYMLASVQIFVPADIVAYSLPARWRLYLVIYNMCHSLNIFVNCAYCDGDRAEVFQCCVSDANSPGCRVGCTVDITSWNCESIFVTCDNFTELAYVCGACVCYASMGVSVTDSPPFDRKYIAKCVANPLSTREYIVKTAHESHLVPAEDGLSCGYVDGNGSTVVIICPYELHGDIGATTVYPRR